MIGTGLVSITFRPLAPHTIVALVAQAGLDAIEWGGDVHVPHGDIHRAHAVRQMTVDAGIAIPSYGSYYRVGHGEPAPFEAIVETAVTLNAPVVRVWAGKQGSAEASEAYWRRVIDDSWRIAALAGEAGLTIAYEYHPNTLTDTDAAAQRLLAAVDHDAVLTYWQPPVAQDVEANVCALQAILPRLANIHVYSWRRTNGDTERMPLDAMAGPWHRYLETVEAGGRQHYAMIEFVRGDTPEQFLEDAETLKRWAAPYRPDLPVFA